MLKCKIKKGGKIRVKANGTTKDLLQETCVLIGDIYRNINKVSPDAAKAYKNALIITLLDPSSPVWKGE